MDNLNIVLIVSDTFRRDHLGCYGNATIRTPHLDRFSGQSVTFDHAYPASFPTLPTRADIMTGRLTYAYRGWEPMPENEITLPQILANNGYHTFGVSDVPFVMRRGYGFDRGFEDFVWVRGQMTGAEHENVTSDWRSEADHFAPTTIATAERWLEKHYQDKFFLYVDTWDPHEPWLPPDHYVSLYNSEFIGETSPYPPYWDWREAGLTARDIDLAHTHYCAEVTMVDRWVGRLIERIESLGLMDRTAVIFLSDHGFYFGEHGLFGKGRFKSEAGYYLGTAPGYAKKTLIFRSEETGEVLDDVEGEWYRGPLYDEVTRVPLMIYAPGVTPRRTKALTSLPDVMPTILELTGSAIPDRVQARSLKPIIQGNENKGRDFVVSTWPLYEAGQTIRVVDDWERTMRENQPSTITDGEWTLLYSVAGDPVELYHTKLDPQQQQNVVADNLEIAKRLHAHFYQLLQELGTSEIYLKSRRQLM